MKQVPEHLSFSIYIVTYVKGDNVLLHCCRIGNIRDEEMTNIYPSIISV